MASKALPNQARPLDITGSADLQTEIDAVAGLLSKGPVADGGLAWDVDGKKVIVRLVGRVDGTSAIVEGVKASVLTAADGLMAKGFSVEFRSVRYSRSELEELAARLFSTVEEWAPGLTTYSRRTGTRTGLGGGWDPEKNRVVLVVPQEKSAAWSERVGALNDDRITLETYLPTPGGIEQRRPRL
ncbi:hypothetical protein ABZX12_19660 [Kribbella sp. NPDC003505]|uniref:hypothetical protein n=1 Tax=Kribbella sp. NPDC003505 TaxID=3154448 RepID=UPI0033ACE1FA